MRRMVGVVLCHNQLDFTKGFVDSVLISNDCKEGFKIVMVNNGSTDGTGEYLKKLASEKGDLFIYRENKENVLFTRACIEVIEEFKGEDIYLLNNDMLVQDGWLSGRDNLGEWAVIGASQLWAENSDFLTFVGGGEDYAQHKSMWRWEAEKIYGKDIHEEKWVTFGAVMLDRTVYDELGGMDSYYQFYCSDSEYCVRVKGLGYKVGVSPLMEVVHFGSQTTKTMLQDVEWRSNFVGNEDQVRFAEEYGLLVGNLDLRIPNKDMLDDWFDNYFNNVEVFERNKRISTEKGKRLFYKYELNGKMVIELGCAYGNTCEELRRLGAIAFGYDISKVAISMGKADYLEAVDIEKYDFTKPFTENSIDFIFSYAFMEHIENYIPVLEQMYKILKVGGIMYHEIDTIAGVDKTHINIQNADKWVKIFTDLGFKVIENKLNGSKMLKIGVQK